MLKEIFFCLVVCAVSINTIAQQRADSLQQIKKSHKGIKRETYSINGREVTKKAFQQFLNTLKEVSGNRPCFEEVIDGETGYGTKYDLKDKFGIIYHYTNFSAMRRTIASLNKKMIN